MLRWRQKSQVSQYGKDMASMGGCNAIALCLPRPGFMSCPSFIMRHPLLGTRPPPPLLPPDAAHRVALRVQRQLLVCVQPPQQIAQRGDIVVKRSPAAAAAAVAPWVLVLPTKVPTVPPSVSLLKPCH